MSQLAALCSEAIQEADRVARHNQDDQRHNPAKANSPEMRLRTTGGHRLTESRPHPERNGKSEHQQQRPK
jgi:hypothetical protein